MHDRQPKKTQKNQRVFKICQERDFLQPGSAEATNYHFATSVKRRKIGSANQGDFRANHENTQVEEVMGVLDGAGRAVEEYLNIKLNSQLIEANKMIIQSEDDKSNGSKTTTEISSERLVDRQANDKTTTKKKTQMQIVDNNDSQDQNLRSNHHQQQQQEMNTIILNYYEQFSMPSQESTTTTTTTNYCNSNNNHSSDDNDHPTAQRMLKNRHNSSCLFYGTNKRTTKPQSGQTTKSFAHERMPAKVFSILLISIIFSLSDPFNDNSSSRNLEQSRQHVTTNTNQNDHHQLTYHQNLLKKLLIAFPRVVVAGASECNSNFDCDKEKICHENRCICGRDKPIEDKERIMCLAHALVNDPCIINEQCLGNSNCLDGYCSCGDEAISIFNPSAKINYCHPKRRINQECSHDAQCPADAFCGGERTGCLCQNGYGPGTVIDGDGGKEIVKCLPKTCSSSDQCESIYHQCEEFRCKCLATHFDPHTAKCYKFGSTGGKPADGSADDEEANKIGNLTSNAAADNNADSGNTFFTSLNDLTGINGEENRILFIVILALIALFILLLIVVFILLIRRHYLGYCWTMSKIGYEPNSPTTTNRPQGPDDPDDKDYFSKNTIKNKSFRKKKNVDGEQTDEDEDHADQSNLVTKNTATKEGSPLATAFSSASAHKNGGTATAQHKSSGYVKVDMSNGDHRKQNGGGPKTQSRSPMFSNESAYGNHYQQFQHHQVVGPPLATSTSTPV